MDWYEEFTVRGTGFIYCIISWMLKQKCIYRGTQRREASRSRNKYLGKRCSVCWWMERWKKAWSGKSNLEKWCKVCWWMERWRKKHRRYNHLWFRGYLDRRVQEWSAVERYKLRQRWKYCWEVCKRGTQSFLLVSVITCLKKSSDN